MHKRFYTDLFLIFSIAVIFLSSCTYKQSQILFDRQNGLPDSILRKAAASNNDEEYKISPQDILQIRNLQNPKYIVETAPINTGVAVGTGTAGQSFQVEKDGYVILPVIGHVHVAGLTRSEASKLIEDLYRKNLLVDPIIEIKITNLKVIMLGEVRGQGNYPLTKDRTTLIELIGQAGGLSEKANETNVKIIRSEQNKTNITVIDLRDVNVLSDPRIIMHNNDIVYVSQNKRAIRSDQVTNLSTILQPGLLILSTALIILSLTRR